MPAATKPIQTSAPQLKDLLAKTGRSLKQKGHHDKLEVLGFLVEQVIDKLKHGHKMKLCLADLNAFLSREGQEEQPDLKGCVISIIKFVSYQHARLGQYVQPCEGKNRNTDLLDSLLKLWAMDNRHVDECFAIEVYSPPVSDGQKQEHVAETGDAKVERIADDQMRSSNSETPNSSMEIVAKLEHIVETIDAKVEPLSDDDDRKRSSNSETTNSSLEIVTKLEHVVETNDAKVDALADDQMRSSNSETPNSSMEIVAKLEHVVESLTDDDDRKRSSNSETPNSSLEIVAKLEHVVETNDAKVDPLADNRKCSSKAETPNASMDIVVKHEHVVETADAKMEPPTNDRKRLSSTATPNTSTEIVVKRCRTDEGLLVAPVEVPLFAEFQRLVPFDILAALAIEDVAKSDTAADSLSERRRLAQAEVDRILKADSEGSAILLGDTANERLGSFRNIVRLLHPEVGLVSDEDACAMKALDLSLRSFVKSELSSEDKAR